MQCDFPFTKDGDIFLWSAYVEIVPEHSNKTAGSTELMLSSQAFYYLYDLSKIPAHSSFVISQGFDKNSPPIVSLAFTASVIDSSGLKP